MHVQIKELDPDNASAAKSVLRLTPIVNERREKMKDEMLGALSPICSNQALEMLMSSQLSAQSSVPLAYL